MDDRDRQRRAFLAEAGWGNADRSALAGDASDRRYFRLTRAGGRAVLMDAPPDGGKDQAAFLRIAAHLNQLGLSAPRLLRADLAAGFLLLEDFGDGQFSTIMDKDAGRLPELYAAATDVLVRLHSAPPPPGLAVLDPPEMGRIAALMVEWYIPAMGGKSGAAVLPALVRAARRLVGGPSVLMLRDYHAGNMIWLPDRAGAARVGLLDFQDAMVAHPAYDLASLLQDARRDVAAGIEADMIGRYVGATGMDQPAFEAAYAVLGCQRAMRILGIFVRLCLHSGKPQYLVHVPRVWQQLQRNLAHPALSELQELCHVLLPEPTAERLARIKDQCPIPPMP